MNRFLYDGDIDRKWFKVSNKDNPSWPGTYSEPVIKHSDPNFASNTKRIMSELIKIYSPWNQQKTGGFLMISGE